MTTIGRHIINIDLFTDAYRVSGRTQVDTTGLLSELMLERGGHTPVLEDNPRKGIELIRAEEPDLLVVDVMMPRLSGRELCQQIWATDDISS